MRKCLIFFILLFLINGCAFQSSQLDLIRQFLAASNNNSDDKPRKNWQVRWMGQQFDLYAINLQDQIIFADEKINIFVSDNHIYKITGLLLESNEISIEKNDNRFVYYENEKKISDGLCENSTRVQYSDTIEISVKCVLKKNNEVFENKLILNDQHQIIRIYHKIHPDYPMLRLSMK